MRSVMTVFGTRPEAIKMAPLIIAMRARTDLAQSVVVTGQHREMLQQVNQLFGISADVDLQLMSPGASLAALSARTLTAVDSVLDRVAPDVVVVQGDTSSAFIAALSAFYRGIPVVHLEAGLRSGDLRAPFPEEGNRRITSQISALHLAPTTANRAHLVREGIDPADVVVTGNTVIDALQAASSGSAVFADTRISRMVDGDERLLLVTAHRRESWGERMIHAMHGVADIARRHPEINVILPLHRNPVVRDAIRPVLDGLANVLLTEPLNYHEFVHLLKRSHVVLTDSGGVQEEAPSLGKPVLVMRDTTERPEAVAAGTVRLVGTDRAAVREATLRLFDDPDAYAMMANAVNPYGDGRAAERCVAAIACLLGIGERLPDFEPVSATAPSCR